jgi:hypothetical protein
MFSMPLAYPSTLDRRSVLRGGALEPESLHEFRKMCKLKHTHVFQRSFRCDAQRSLSLSGGASIRSSACSSWASPLVLSLHKKGDLVGRPRLARYAARELARTPPSEGFDVGRPTLRFEGAPAQCRRRDGRRLGEIHVAVGCDHHGVVVIAGPEHRSNIGRTQGFLEDFLQVPL